METSKPTAARFAAHTYTPEPFKRDHCVTSTGFRHEHGIEAGCVLVHGCADLPQAERIARGLNTCLSMLLDMERTATPKSAEGPRYITEHSNDTPLFICWTENEGEENANAPATLAEYLADNKDDDELCEWLRRAAPGETFKTGGGAAPIIYVRRVLG